MLEVCRAISAEVLKNPVGFIPLNSCQLSVRVAPLNHIARKPEKDGSRVPKLVKSHKIFTKMVFASKYFLPPE